MLANFGDLVLDIWHAHVCIKSRTFTPSHSLQRLNILLLHWKHATEKQQSQAACLAEPTSAACFRLKPPRTKLQQCSPVWKCFALCFSYCLAFLESSFQLRGGEFDADLWASLILLSASSLYLPQLCPEMVSHVWDRPVEAPHSQQKACSMQLRLTFQLPTQADQMHLGSDRTAGK